MEKVLDMCCGSKMFWFDKEDDRVLFLDKRSEVLKLKDKSSNGGYRNIEIKPDVIGDFRNLPFEDNIFSLCVFDPPHFKRNGSKGWMNAKYGTLTDEWETDLRKGFKEGFRVLKPNGTLVFKWNENEISLSKILSLTDKKPLFGNKYGKNYESHFIVFIK